MTEIFTQSIATVDFRFEKPDFARYLPGDEHMLDYFLKNPIREIIDDIRSNKTRVLYYITEAKLQYESILIEQIVFNTGKQILSNLQGTEKIVVFGCSLGKVLVSKLHQYQDMEKSYVADIVGTLLIEKATDKITELVQQMPKYCNIDHTDAYCPGNCGWNIADTKRLLQLLPGNFLEISINNGGMLNPVKSLIGIIGLGSGMKKQEHNCSKCNSKCCMYRMN